LVVSLAPVENFISLILAYRPAFACKALATSKLRITLALSLRFAVLTIQELSLKLFPLRFRLVRHSLLHVQMPAATIRGRDSRPLPSTTSILLDTVHLMLASGVIHPNPLATMLQSTLASAQRTVSHGFQSWPTSQRPPSHTRGALRSRVTSPALASMRTVNTAPTRDAIKMAAQLVSPPVVTMSLMLTLSTGVCHLRHCDLYDHLSAIVYDMTASLPVVESWCLLQPLFFAIDFLPRDRGHRL
jgi:hypothetical protein